MRLLMPVLVSLALTGAIDADPRLPTQRDKCRVFRTLAGWSPGFTCEQYASAGAHGCADYPFDSYPWSG